MTDDTRPRRFMDANECNTTIAAARAAAGKSSEEVLADLENAAGAFRQAARDYFR